MANLRGLEKLQLTENHFQEFPVAALAGLRPNTRVYLESNPGLPAEIPQPLLHLDIRR